jgi:hypothetical protein
MVRILPLIGPLVLLLGCGDDGRVPLYSAGGSVLVDGRPAQGVEVRLHPLGRFGDLDALRPFATTDAQGQFRLGTYVKDDGAPEGQYRATLYWPDRPPGPSASNDQLGGAYSEAQESPFNVTIAEGENQIPPFEAKAPAPAFRPPAKSPVRPDFDGVGSSPAS